MFIKLFWTFISIIPLLANDAVASSRYERRLQQADKATYQVESHDQYQFNLCRKYEKDNEDYYMFKCDEDEVFTSSLSNLERDQYRISKRIYSEHFLKDLKSFTLESLKKNEEDISSLIKCIDSKSPECESKIESVKNYVRTKLPSYRKTIVLANIEKISGRGFTFYNISEDVEHDSLDYDLPELSSEEYKEINKLKEEISYNIRQDSLSQIKHKCVTYDYEYKTDRCPRKIDFIVKRDLSRGIDRVKEQYQKEYYKRTDADNLLARLNLRGNENDREILEELKKQLTQSVKANRKAYKKISKLTDDDDLIDLIKNQSAVQGYLQTQAVSKASCDMAQSLYNDVQSDKLMTSLYIGGAAIVGGGICVGTFGLGCAIGVGVAAGAIDLVMEQNNLNSSRLSYSAGIGSVESIESAESDRNLALAFVAIGSVGNITKPTVKVAKAGYSSARKSLDNILSEKKSIIDLRDIRNYAPPLIKKFPSSTELKKKYSEYSLTTSRVNKRWIDNANDSNASLYLDVENAALKRLNDSLGDKELVTSLTNLHKDVLYDRINKLIKKYNGIELEVYSDFKSLRFAFTPKDIPEDIKKKLLKDLNKTYQSANEEYASMIKNMDGIGKENPTSWFEGGFATTADGAGQAAKRARSITRPFPQLVSFDDIKRLVDQDLNSIKSYSSTLRESPLYNANLVDEIPGGSGRTVKLEVIEAVRKSVGKYKQADIDEIVSSSPIALDNKALLQKVDARVVQKSLKKKFGVELSDEESAGLVGYIGRLDGLTPGLRQATRTNASLDKASLGGFSGDVTGMGARNIQQVAFDVSKTSTSKAEDILKATRNGEQSVTQTFNNIKDNFTTTVQDVFKKRGLKYNSKCSGDDCIVIPDSVLTKNDEIAVINAFRTQKNPSQYRLSFIPPNIESSKRTLLATHGELMEKELRKQITGVAKDKISYDRLSKITMGTRMPSSVNTGKVELYLGVGKNVELSSSEKRLIEDAYAKAVKNINKDLSAESQDATSFLYDSGGVNFID